MAIDPKYGFNMGWETISASYVTSDTFSGQPPGMAPPDKRVAEILLLLPTVPNYRSSNHFTYPTNPTKQGISSVFCARLPAEVSPGSVFGAAFQIELIYQGEAWTKLLKYGWLGNQAGVINFYWESTYNDVVVTSEQKTALLPLVAETLVALRKIIPEAIADL